MNLYTKVLVLITDSSDPRPAFERALGLAQRGGAELTLLDVGEPFPQLTQTLIPAGTLSALEKASVEQRVAALESLADEARKAGATAVTTKAVNGSPFRIAIRAVVDERHDLLVKTIDTRDGRSRSMYGSTDKHLLRKCPCALWLVAAEEDSRGPVLAAVNPDPAEPEENALSTDILSTAAAIAALDGRELHIVHAWKVFGELLLRGPAPLVSDPDVDYIVGQTMNRHAGFLDALVERVAMSVVPHLHLIHARPADAIIDLVQSQSPSLLVMGTVGRTGIPGLLIGNTAERVLSEVTRSVLALKPRGFVTPVGANTGVERP